MRPLRDEWPNQSCPKLPRSLSCPAAILGAMGVFSTSSASLFFRWSSAGLSSSFLHVAITLRPLSITICRRFPGSNAAFFHPSSSPVPNNQRPSATQAVHSFSRAPFHAGDPLMIHLDNLQLSIRMSAPAHHILLVRTVVSMFSQPIRSRASSYQRFGGPAICIRLQESGST